MERPSKYDTRGLEAAYLAGGQARQVKEILDSIKLYEALTARSFDRRLSNIYWTGAFWMSS